MQEQTIFIEALEKEDPVERAAFLDQVCASDPVLRRRIEKLLKRNQEAGNFLETPPLGPAATVEPFVRDGPGTMIGPFKLLEQIGEGGFALVFLAEQSQPVRRQVAVKILKPGMDSRQVIARFEAERQALALMDHPNIARVLDAGETASGRPHFVMELARGVPITAYCDQNGLGTRQRLELFATVCAAVQYAHQKGIIHRDIKPSNVLVTLGEGVVKIIDFGIAKAIGPSLTDPALHTGVNQMIGTPLYMSPEQAQMGAVDVDTRSDVYSLGVLVYELLTGTTPFGEERLRTANYDEIRRIIREEDPAKPSTRLSTMGEAATVVAERRQGDPQRLSRLCRGELDWIVMKALEKDRARRYESAAAFAADIQHYLKDEPVSACPPSAWYRFGKVARRNKGTLVTAALVSFALLAGTTVSVWQAIRATDAASAERRALLDLGAEQQATRRELERAQEAEKRATHAEKKATLELFDSLVAQARANRLSRRIGQRFGTLDIVRKATAMARQLGLPDERFLELRNEAIAALALPDLRVAKEWPHPLDALVQFDASFKRYACADREGTVQLRDGDDGKIIYSLAGVGPGNNWVALSRDAGHLAVFEPTRRRIHVWKLTGAAPKKILNETALGSSFFSPDSRQLALQEIDGAISLFDLTTSTRTRRLPKMPHVNHFAWHPDGGRLALGCSTFVRVCDFQTGADLWHKDFAAGYRSIAWHPEGNILAVEDGEAIALWDVTQDRQISKLDGIHGSGLDFAFNPAGTVLANSGWAGILRFWDPLTGRELFSTPQRLLNPAPQFSADGRFLAATQRDDKLYIWEFAAAHEYRTLVASPLKGKREYGNVTVSPDGRFLAAGAQGATVLWDLPTGRELAFREGSRYNFVGFARRSARQSGAKEEEQTLLTTHNDGFFHWPIRADRNRGAVTFGPAERQPVPVHTCMFARSQDEKIMAFSQLPNPVVVHADMPDQAIKLDHYDARHVAVSPDGRWVATSRFSYPGGTKIWEVTPLGNGVSCTLAKELPGGAVSAPAFSPDGRYLLISAVIESRPIRRWKVGTWEERPFKGPVEGARAAFSPAGKLMVLETGAGVARLLDPETGREMARLEGPHPHGADQFAFTPDGTKLVCASGNGFCVYVWDVQTIRRQLAEMGLDWQ